MYESGNWIISVFIFAGNADHFRQMAILAKEKSSLTFGEYVLIFFFTYWGDPNAGNYNWERGDDLDQVRRLLNHRYDQHSPPSPDHHQCKQN
ncbi:hypothetical protein DPMN_073210 [Dreissena polymorpha]|uniref:Uncharacterized protein n=1 Tax=Dreissena polymorpha TaxID=45954 RepID=A0A9D4BYM1_DREPO|nr:hypothetical protein DPMN_073210 [Dreissena polymorpha]